MIGYCDRFLRALCEQAESIRDTCSRDPAQNREDIRIVGKLIFFSKTKNDKVWQAKKKVQNMCGYMYRDMAIYTGVILLVPCSDDCDYFDFYNHVVSQFVLRMLKVCVLIYCLLKQSVSNWADRYPWC